MGKGSWESKIKENPELTAFQKKVLLAVMEIPRGKTRSYAWTAAKAGRSGAARAAGNALNKNPYAPYVPCHRVIASDGSIGGYAHGTEKKKRLLKKEGVRFKDKKGTVKGKSRDKRSGK